MDEQMRQPFPGTCADALQHSIIVLTIASPFRERLAQYPALTRPAGQPRRLDTPSSAPERLKIAKADFEVMVRSGARRSESPWATPLPLMPKKSSNECGPTVTSAR